MVIQTWMLGRRILKNEQSVCAIVRKAPDTVVVDKIWAIKRKLVVWKTCIYHHEVDGFPIHKSFSDKIGGNVNKLNF